MGTNSTGCTEWERDYDPVTEKPYAPDYKEGIERKCCLCRGKLKKHEYQICDECDFQTG